MPRKPNLTDADRAAVSQAIRHARLIETSRKAARIVKHEDPPPEVVAERERLEADFPAWLRFHGGEAFADKWSPDHLAVLAKIKEAIDKGGHFALAMPRGHGKTTILKWALLYVMLTGKRRYVVVVAATAELAGALTDFVRAQLIENPTLLEHYPHVCHYAKATEGKAIKAKYMLRRDFKPLGLGWGKATLILPTPMGRDAPYPSDGAVLEGHGLTGAIRGKWRDDKAGKVMRPDFVLLDDPQTRESAESPSQCAMRERIITGDVLGLAGPRKKIAAVMPCTVIRKGDLAHRFLNHDVHPEWQGETCQLVKAWPKAQDTLWREYATLYRDGIADGEGTEAAFEFYRRNRARMDEGAVMAWEHRVRGGELSALQTAENLLIETGDQFWAEYQNDPKDIVGGQYELTVEQVLRHVSDTPRLHLPEAASVFVAHADVNRSGLHWCACAFDQKMTAHVVAYGNQTGPRGMLWAENATEHVRQTAIFRALVELCGILSQTKFMRGGAAVVLDALLVDASFESNVVHGFAHAARYPFKVIPAIGRAAHRYRWNRNTIVGKPAEDCHLQRPQNRLCPYVMGNVDKWREVMQRAFLGERGEPGGCTIHAAGGARGHVAFAEHVVAERLANKYETDLGMRWEWTHAPGTEWDWGDALTGCWIAAATRGLTSTGMTAVKNKHRAAAVVGGRRVGGSDAKAKETATAAAESGVAKKKRRAVIGRPGHGHRW